MSKRLEAKTAIITGAAHGIGAAAATLMAAAGANVVVADINATAGQNTVKAIQQQGGNAHFFALDVTDNNQWLDIIDFTLSTYGQLTTLVNNAGAFHPGNIANETLEGWQHLIAVNQTSLFMALKAARQSLIDSGNGAIVNISSLYGLVGSPNAISYHATKAAVRHMTRAAALELAPFNVRVNAILPGQIQTQMLAAITPEQAHAIQQATPLGRIGDPVDIANGIVFLCADESKFVTGIDLIIDGGWAAGA